MIDYFGNQMKEKQFTINNLIDILKCNQIPFIFLANKSAQQRLTVITVCYIFN